MKSRSPAAAQHRHGAVDRVALADAAQVHAHARPREAHGAGPVVDDDGAVVDPRQPGGDLGGGGHAVVLVVVELPHLGQRAERDVELRRRSTSLTCAAACSTRRVSSCTRHRRLPGGAR